MPGAAHRPPAPRRTRGALLLLGFATLAASLGCEAAPDGPPSVVPSARDQEPWWLERHHMLKRQARSRPIDLLFLGDSITQGWHGRGRDIYEGDGIAVWNQFYAARRAANFGMGSDRTQHVLWRLRDGELGRARPKVVVLLIGTNNLVDDSPEVVVAGVGAILDELARRAPRSRILLLGLLPRGLGRPAGAEHAEPDPKVGQANVGLKELADSRQVSFLDMSGAFLDERGRIPRALMPDFLHLSRQGYRAWAEAMEPTLTSLLESDAN